MTVDEKTRVKQSQHVFVREFDGELVVLDLARGEYFGLDALGARTWNGLIAGRTVTQLADEFVRAYDVDLDTLRSDLVSLLRELVDRGLVEVEP